MSYRIAFLTSAFALISLIPSSSTENPHIIQIVPVPIAYYEEEAFQQAHLHDSSLEGIQFLDYRNLKHNFTKVARSNRLGATNNLGASNNRGATNNLAQQPSLGLTQELYCPAGQTFQNNQCVRTVMYKPHLMCPVGTRKHGHTCIDSKLATATCPEGYRAHGKHCIQSIAQDVTYSCTGTGEEFDPLNRLCKRMIQSANQCPSSYTMNADGTCSRATLAIPQCPSGYSLADDQRTCYVENVSLGALSCPGNSTYNEDTHQCISVYNAPPRCAEGYTYHPDQQTCVGLVGKVANDCPVGFSLTDNGMCQRLIQSNPGLTCPEGYSLRNGVCTTLLSARPSCNDGFEYNNGRCERIVDEVPVCQTNTVPVTVAAHNGGVATNQCQMAVTSNLTQCCETGFELVNGSCVRRILSAPQWTCEQDCFNLGTSAPSYICPNGTEFGYLASESGTEEPSCARNTTLEICIQAYNTSIDCSANDAAGTFQLRHLQDDIPDALCGNTPVCHNISRLEVFDVQLFCPNGGEVVNNTCLTYEAVTPEPICNSGNFDEDTGQCVSLSTNLPTSKCPDGTIQNGFNCLSYTYLEPTYECPTGSAYNEDNVCVETSFPNVGSPQTHNLTPTATCNNGEYLNSDGTACMRGVLAALTYGCPTGSEESADGYCIVTTSTLLSAPLMTAYTPQYVCPDEAVSSTRGTCSQFDYVDSVPGCVADTALDATGTNCVHTTSPILKAPYALAAPAEASCPANMKRRGQLCVGTMVQRAILSCDSADAVLKDGHCLVQSVPTSVCPRGTAATADGCARQLTTPARVRVVQGCVTQPLSDCDECPEQLMTQCF